MNKVIVALAITAALVPSLTTSGWAKSSKPKPPSIEVRKGKAKIGSEVVRSRTGEANTYHSTSAKLRDAGRSFTQRAHLMLDAKGEVVTYDRWIDVKGATIRIRAFNYEGTWKLVLFGQPGEKNKVTDFKIKGAPVIFDERSPMVNGLAAVLAGKRASVPYIRIDDTTAGEAKVERQALVDASGTRYVRTRFVAPKFEVEVIRDGEGKTVWTTGPGGYAGKSGALDPSRLQPAGDAGDVAAPPTEKGSDTPPAPPSDDPEGRAIPRPAGDAAGDDEGATAPKKAAPSKNTPGKKAPSKTAGPGADDDGTESP